MRICLFTIALALATLLLTNCGLFDRSAHAQSNPSQLDTNSAVKYLRLKADILEKQQASNQLLTTLVSDMVTECKSKHIGDAIQLDQYGVPTCVTIPKPPVAPIPAPAQPKADSK